MQPPMRVGAAQQAKLAQGRHRQRHTRPAQSRLLALKARPAALEAAHKWSSATAN